jgi:hypothetical protein
LSKCAIETTVVEVPKSIPIKVVELMSELNILAGKRVLSVMSVLTYIVFGSIGL